MKAYNPALEEKGRILFANKVELSKTWPEEWQNGYKLAKAEENDRLLMQCAIALIDAKDNAQDTYRSLR